MDFDKAIIKARVACCHALMHKLFPEGRPPLGDAKLYNQYVAIKNCHHFLESAIAFYNEGDLDSATWCGTWPDDVHPEIMEMIDD